MDPTPPDLRSTLAEMLDELRRIRVAVESPGRVGSTPNPKHARLIEAIAVAMAGYDDLEFFSEDVLEARESDHALDVALSALRISDTATLGAVFRSLCKRKFDGLRLVRDGRGWRVVRT